MDVYKTQKVKARKTKVIARKSKVQILSNLFFQAIEITVVVVTVAKLFHQLVTTFENSGERFKGLAAVLASRHFVFVAGNVIAITLFIKSGQFRTQESDARTAGNGFYEEFVRESRREEPNLRAEVKNRGKQSITENEGQNEINTRQSTTGNRQRKNITKNEGVTETKGKQSTTETRQRQSKSESRGKQSTTENRQKQSAVENEGATETTEKHSPSEDRQRPDIVENRAKQSKNYVRSRSENSENPKISGGRLQRSETERFSSEEHTSVVVTNDELRYKIESFIARQKRNQKDEEFCIT